MVAAAPSAKEAEGPHSLYTTHLAILLREAAPQLDAAFTAEALLATLAPAHHLRLRTGSAGRSTAHARRLGRAGRRARYAAPSALKPITMRASPETAQSV